MLKEGKLRRDALKEDLQSGDFSTIAKMLGITPDNVRIRFFRCRDDVLEAAEFLIDNRVTLIESYKMKKMYL